MLEEIDWVKPVSTVDFYQLIRGQIDSENSLMNEPVNWLIISPSFFFNGFATLLSSPSQPEDGIYAQLQADLLWLIPGISLATTLLIYIDILALLLYVAELRQSYHTYHQDSVIKHFSPV